MISIILLARTESELFTGDTSEWQSFTRTRELKATPSLTSSAKEKRECGSAFQSVMAWGKKLHLQIIKISVSNGDLICHRMMIPAAPNQGDKVICWYRFTNASHAPSLIVIVSCYKPSSWILNFFELILKANTQGVQNRTAIFQDRVDRSFTCICCLFYLLLTSV